MNPLLLDPTKSMGQISSFDSSPSTSRQSENKAFRQAFESVEKASQPDIKKQTSGEGSESGSTRPVKRDEDSTGKRLHNQGNQQETVESEPADEAQIVAEAAGFPLV